MFKKKIKTGEELLKRFVRKSQSQSMSDSAVEKTLSRIFSAYDLNGSGHLTQEEAVRLISEILSVTGLQEEVWEDAQVNSNPNDYYQKVVTALVNHADAGHKGYLDLTDLKERLKPDSKFQSVVRRVSEQMETELALEAFNEVIEEDVATLKEAYKTSPFVKARGIKYDEEAGKILIPTKTVPMIDFTLLLSVEPSMHQDVLKTTVVAIPKTTSSSSSSSRKTERGEKGERGEKKHRKRVSAGISKTHLLAVKKIDAAVKAASSQSHASLNSCLSAFISAVELALKIETGGVASLTESKLSWKARSNIIVFKSVERSEFAIDCHEATLYFGPKTVVFTEENNTVRIRVHLNILSREFLDSLGFNSAQNLDNASALISIQFPSTYTLSPVPPTVSAQVSGMLDDGDDTTISDDFNPISEIMSGIANQFLKDWWSTHAIGAKSEHSLQKLAELCPQSPFDDVFAAFVVSRFKLEHGARILKSKANDFDLKPLPPVIPPGATDSPLVKVLLKQSVGNCLDEYTLEQCVEFEFKQRAYCLALLKAKFRVERGLELLMDLGAEVNPDSMMELASMKTKGSSNLILHLASVLILSLNSLSGTCLLCGDPIGPNIVGSDLAICTKGICQYSHIEMRVYDSVPLQIMPTGAAADLRADSDIVDILVSMCWAAANSHRATSIFNPFPPQHYANGVKDIPAVVKLLNLLPSVSTLKSHSKNEGVLMEFLSKLDKGSNQLYTLLLWILSVMRSPLVKIPQERRMKSMVTSHQYYLMAGTDPQRRKVFREAASEYGSYLAFHGSSIENWHAILRVGLLNMSGSSLQTAGAAYGPGVYMAADSSTSFGYSRQGRVWPKSEFFESSNGQCIAVAEVAKAPGVVTQPNPYYVVPQDQFILPRLFFLFSGNTARPNVAASTLKLSKYR